MWCAGLTGEDPNVQNLYGLILFNCGAEHPRARTAAFARKKRLINTAEPSATDGQHRNDSNSGSEAQCARSFRREITRGQIYELRRRGQTCGLKTTKAELAENKMSVTMRTN